MPPTQISSVSPKAPLNATVENHSVDTSRISGDRGDSGDAPCRQVLQFIDMDLKHVTKEVLVSSKSIFFGLDDYSHLLDLLYLRINAMSKVSKNNRLQTWRNQYLRSKPRYRSSH